MYNGSWNLSFTRACCNPMYIARARGECVCEFNRNLKRSNANELINWRIDRRREETHPLNSRNRQITLATTSSFFSRGAEPLALIFVLAANRSVEVAPKASAKSIVED